MLSNAWRYSRCLAIPLLALALCVAPALAADPITMRVEVFGLAGLRVLTLRSQIDEAGERYAITIDYATSGVAGWFVDIKTHAQVRGRLGAGWAQPELFRNETRRDGKERHNKVDYHPDGTIDGSSSPPVSEPVPLASMRGTVDNLTAYFLLERQLARTGSCGLAVPVFDGRHRYDLFFTDAGEHKLEPKGGQEFEGATKACHMQRRNVAPAEGGETSEGARAGTIWYAKLIPEAAVMVPVRSRFETQIGGVDGYLAEIHGRGVDLKLLK